MAAIITPPLLLVANEDDLRCESKHLHREHLPPVELKREQNDVCSDRFSLLQGLLPTTNWRCAMCLGFAQLCYLPLQKSLRMAEGVPRGAFQIANPALTSERSSSKSTHHHSGYPNNKQCPRETYSRKRGGIIFPFDGVLRQ